MTKSLGSLTFSLLLALCFLSSVFCFLISHSIEHPINDHTGYRHIQPNRKCDAGNPYVPVKAAPEGLRKGQDRKRRDSDRKSRMGNQNRKINGPNPAVMGKRRPAMMEVVIKVGGKKEC